MNNLLKIFAVLLIVLPVIAQAQTTLILQPQAAQGKDAIAYKSTGSPSTETTNYEPISYMRTQSWTSGPYYLYYRSFIEFDLSSIPEGAWVTSATLYLYGMDSGTGHDPYSQSNESWVERVTQHWYEDSLTWANQPPVDTTVRATIPESQSTYEDYVLDVTSLYQEIINRADSDRHGIRLKDKDETAHSRLTFKTSDDTGDTLELPKLVITYYEPICGHWMGDCNATGLTHRGGGVAIGTSVLPDGYKLAVNGNMICEEVLVEYYERWPDYVFDEGYGLMPLDELETFIKENKHLPGVPSQSEVKNKGFKAGEMDAILLEKIEELTLYTIENQKQIDVLKEKVEQLEGQKSKRVR